MRPQKLHPLHIDIISKNNRDFNILVMKEKENSLEGFIDFFIFFNWKMFIVQLETTF